MHKDMKDKCSGKIDILKFVLPYFLINFVVLKLYACTPNVGAFFCKSLTLKFPILLYLKKAIVSKLIEYHTIVISSNFGGLQDLTRIYNFKIGNFKYFPCYLLASRCITSPKSSWHHVFKCIKKNKKVKCIKKFKISDLYILYCICTQLGVHIYDLHNLLFTYTYIFVYM